MSTVSCIVHINQFDLNVKVVIPYTRINFMQILFGMKNILNTRKMLNLHINFMSYLK